MESTHRSHWDSTSKLGSKCRPSLAFPPWKSYCAALHFLLTLGSKGGNKVILGKVLLKVIVKNRGAFKINHLHIGKQACHCGRCCQGTSETNTALVLRKGQLSGEPFRSKNGQDFLFCCNEGGVLSVAAVSAKWNTKGLYYQAQAGVEVLLTMGILHPCLKIPTFSHSICACPSFVPGLHWAT